MYSFNGLLGCSGQKLCLKFPVFFQVPQFNQFAEVFLTNYHKAVFALR